MRYYPEIFRAKTMDAARQIILTDEGPGADTNSRWLAETPYVVDLIRSHIHIGPDSTVLDYGCGIGRIAKALIDRTGCSVVGLDISPEMRALSLDYVGSPRFTAVSLQEFDSMVSAGVEVDASLAIWVLQHCFDPKADIARLMNCLRPGGRAFVLNMLKRAIPAVDEANTFAWAVDGQDVAALLQLAGEVEATGAPDATLPNMADAGAFWMKLRRRAP